MLLRLAPKSQKSRLRRLVHALMRMVRGVLLLEDTPHRIAIGSAMGLFFGIQPLVGSQMATAALASRLARGNVLASLPWTWITNPFTFAPIYYASYQLGCCVFPGGKQVTIDDFTAIGARLSELGMWDSLFSGLGLLMDIFLPLQTGTALLGLLGAGMVYPLVRKLVNLVQQRRLTRRSRWSATVHRLLPESGAPPAGLRAVDPGAPS